MASLINAQPTTGFAPGEQVVSSQKPAPEIYHGVLTPHQSLIRKPLQSWADKLSRRLDELTFNGIPDRLIDCQQIVGCYNEAALIELFFGRPRHAFPAAILPRNGSGYGFVEDAAVQIACGCE